MPIGRPARSPPPAVHFNVGLHAGAPAKGRRGGSSTVVSFRELRHHLTSLDHRSKRLKTNRLSLHADLLEKRSHASGVDFQHIMQADFVLFLRGSLGALRHAGEQWWPDTLLYCEEYRGPFEKFARARSAKYFIRIAGLVDITKKD